MGPEGGSGGGEIVAVGTPEEIAATQGSHTGYWLSRMLKSAPEQVKVAV
jgi:excinuclease ABC subunit A